MWGGGGELTPNADAGFSTSTVVRPPFEKKCARRVYPYCPTCVPAGAGVSDTALQTFLWKGCVPRHCQESEFTGAPKL